jgi:uncharacterized protein (TIGR02271 family)
MPDRPTRRRIVDRARTNRPPAPDADRSVTLPVVAEELVVGKRRVRRGAFRVRKAVRAREVVVDEPGVRDEVEIRRVAIGRPVTKSPGIRQDGDTLIIPILEEVVVVERRLVLKEELRITRRRVETRDPRRVTVRTEEPVVERLAGAGRPIRGAAASLRGTYHGEDHRRSL